MPSKNSNKLSLYEALGSSFTIPTDDAGLKRVFDYFDRDSSGTVDYREFAAAYKEFEEAMGVPVSTRDVGRKFKATDKNGDNQLSFEEFAHFMVSRAAK